jgi:hypothetical protein
MYLSYSQMFCTYFSFAKPLFKVFKWIKNCLEKLYIYRVSSSVL